MAGAMRKVGVYLGLLEDGDAYDEYDDTAQQAPEQRAGATRYDPPASQPAVAVDPRPREATSYGRAKQEMVDPQTGLLTRKAFWRDLAGAMQQSAQCGVGLSVARFTGDGPDGVNDGTGQWIPLTKDGKTMEVTEIHPDKKEGEKKES